MILQVHFFGLLRERAKIPTLLFFFVLSLYSPYVSSQSSLSTYLSKALLPNDTVKHTNEAVVLQSGSDSVFYFTQKAAPGQRIAEFHLFLFQKKTGTEVKIPFPKELQADRLLFIDNENKTMFFTCAVNGDDIYYSKLIAGKWQKPMPFAALNSSFRESGMCISPDKRRIVFASNRNSQNNNLDLYYIDYQEDGLWKKPQLFSQALTSNEDEDDPRFSKDGKTFYFASKGFNSLGNYDLFMSTFDEGKNTWSDPINLGPHINSTFNEISPSLNTRGELALFCSDRYSKVFDYDIYRPVKERKEAFSIQVNDSDSSLQIGNLQVQLVPDDAHIGDGNKAIQSETGLYADSLFLNRWYTVRIMDGTQLLVNDRVRFTSQGSKSKAYYISLDKIKDPYLIYQGKKIPLLTKYVLRYESEEQLPNKHNQKALERVAELLGHLHIYQVEIQYPSNLPKDQQKIVATRVDRLEKYLVKNRASSKDIVLSKQTSGEPNQLVLKMEFKLKVH